MSIPTISVIMPVYNTERYLSEAIESVRDQSFPDFEFLIMDDGSTDSSPEIAGRHASQDSRIRVIQLEHAGQAMASNEGLRLARGRWIARLDADDVAAPQRFSRQLDVLKACPEAVAVGAYATIIGENGRVVGMHRFGPVTPDEFRKTRESGPMYLINSSVVFCRQAALNVGGFRPGYEPAEDIDLWSRLADDHVILVAPEPLVSYRIHTKASSTRRFREQLQSARRVKANTLRRRAGQAELSRDEFGSMESQRPFHHRLRIEVAGRSQQCYRRGGALLAAGRPIGVAWLVAALALYPPLPVKRLYRQGVLAQLLGHRQTKDDANLHRNGFLVERRAANKEWTSR